MASRMVLGFAGLLLIAGCRSEVPACAPSASTSATAEPSSSGPSGAPFAIEVARDGTVSLEGARLADASELTSRTKMALQTRPQLHVMITADKDAAYDRVIRVADLVKAGGAKHLDFAVSKTGAPAARTSTPTGASGGEPAPPTVPTPSLFPGEEWKCPHPNHHGHDDGHHNLVEVFVGIHVDASGKAWRVDVINDPGGGYGDAARECAMQRTYKPAVDPKGNAVPGVLKLHIRYGQ